jgi:hypothetical protein
VKKIKNNYATEFFFKTFINMKLEWKDIIIQIFIRLHPLNIHWMLYPPIEEVNIVSKAYTIDNFKYFIDSFNTFKSNTHVL